MLRVTSYAFQVIKYLFEIAEDAISQTGGLYFDRRYAYNALARKEYLARKRIKHPPKQISDTIRYLNREGYIAFEGGKGSITHKALQSIAISNLEVCSKKWPKKWDKKWRVVFFDIPEKEKIKREILRSVLKRLGFQKCQKSVWISKKPIKDELVKICNLFGIQDMVILLEVNTVILGDRFFKED